MASALQGQVPHVSLLMGEIAAEKVAGTDLKAGITVCMCTKRNRKKQ